MTRRRLWSLVALACTGLILPGVVPHVPAQNAAVQARAWIEAMVAAWSAPAWSIPAWSAPAWSIPASLRGHPWTFVLLAAALGLGLVAGRALYSRRGGVRGQVRRLSRRGLPVAAIARRTGLAQDAIRDLLGAKPIAATWGSLDYHPAAGAAGPAQEAR
ncbi:MAG TPA: hypothetical protein VFS11_01790 [Gemmatimonadales bacterium]|nr:hypothetical protein [Gemmatimonadales bacterium]